MNTEITSNDLAAILSAAYGHGESTGWDYKTSQPIQAGDGLLTLLLSETAPAADCKSVFEALAESARLIETIGRDVELTISNLNLYIVNALTANYLEWFLSMGHDVSKLFDAVPTWQYNVKGHVRETYCHVVAPRLEQLGHELEDEMSDPNALPLPEMMLQKLQVALMIGAEFLPKGGNPEPLYASKIEVPATPVRDGACPADGQALPQQGVAVGQPPSP